VIQKDFPLPRQPEVDPPVEDAGEGEGNPFAPPSPLMLSLQRRARKFWEATAHSRIARNIFGTGFR
jgi:hypothetical protein